MRFLVLFIFSLTAFSQNFSKQELKINDIEGTLFTNPKANKLVILISGSGANNRSGNSLASQNNSLKYLAENLAEKGLAVYSYDKRSFTQVKNKDFSEITFQNFVDDAITVLQYFKNKYKKHILIGHSQGSLISMLVQQKQSVDAFISLAGPANSMDKILFTQLIDKLPNMEEKISLAIDKIKNGEEYEPPYILNSIFNKQTQPFLKEWMQYNPIKEFSKITIPTMVINGTKDLQVPVSEAKLLKAANKKAKLLIIKNMNHVLKNCTSEEDNLKSYKEPKREINKKLAKAIVQFIAKKT